MNKTKREKGFTLIEILIVIGIIAILATIVIIAINPARQFAQARDTQRTSNVNAILNAIGQRIADNKGVFDGTFVVSGITYTCSVLPVDDTTPIVATDISYIATGSTATGDLGCLVPTYLSQSLNDPKSGSPAYTVVVTNGRVTVAAPGAEVNTPISVTR